jgi:hypothetical protein
MVPQQKLAWFNLAVFGVAALIYLGLWPVVGAKPAMAAIAVCGFWGLAPLFFRKRRLGNVVLDERDQLISLRAQLAGLWVFWECLVLGCVGGWAVLRYVQHRETITVEVLPLLVFGGFTVFTVTQSVAILVQYGRSRRDENA